MPRAKRLESITNIYHVIIRGNNKQNIFLNDKDYRKFLNILEKNKNDYGYSVYSYILMTNHVHIIIDVKNANISKIMHSIVQEYSMYFNGKHNRCGHVFQDRFKSKGIETQEYLLNLQRYIHLNCVKAKMAKIDEYEWSSYNEYIKEEKICETDVILKMFGSNKREAVKNFIIFNNKRNLNPEEQDIAEFEMRNNLTDSEAIEEVSCIIDNDELKNIKNCENDRITEIVKECLKINRISQKQISKILKISTKRVAKIKNDSLGDRSPV